MSPDAHAPQPPSLRSADETLDSIRARRPATGAPYRCSLRTALRCGRSRRPGTSAGSCARSAPPAHPHFSLLVRPTARSTETGCAGERRRAASRGSCDGSRGCPRVRRSDEPTAPRAARGRSSRSRRWSESRSRPLFLPTRASRPLPPPPGSHPMASRIDIRCERRERARASDRRCSFDQPGAARVGSPIGTTCEVSRFARTSREGYPAASAPAQGLGKRRSMSTDATVIVYHGVGDCPPAQDPYRMFMPIEKFARHMEFLARHRRVVPLEDIVSGRVGKGRRAVAVTFDDGYRSVLDEAVPVSAAVRISSRLLRAHPLDRRGKRLGHVQADRSRTPDSLGRGIGRARGRRRQGREPWTRAHSPRRGRRAGRDRRRRGFATDPHRGTRTRATVPRVSVREPIARSAASGRGMPVRERVLDRTARRRNVRSRAGHHSSGRQHGAVRVQDLGSLPGGAGVAAGPTAPSV